jgi:hypothetical protein
MAGKRGRDSVSQALQDILASIEESFAVPRAIVNQVSELLAALDSHETSIRAALKADCMESSSGSEAQQLQAVDQARQLLLRVLRSRFPGCESGHPTAPQGDLKAKYTGFNIQGKPNVLGCAGVAMSTPVRHASVLSIGHQPRTTPGTALHYLGLHCRHPSQA